MNNTALAVIKNVDDIERIATSMAKSGYFQDSREMAQAVVKIMAGQEMGFGPFASMIGVHIIQGKPGFSANLMAAAVKSSGRYDYRILEITDAACEIAFFEGGKEAGRSRFTKEDAGKAGTQNMNKFARNMLFARAMSNGVRWYCPDVFSGAVAYTPEELGATVNEDGDVIPGSFVEAPAPVPTLKPLTPLKPVTVESVLNEKHRDDPELRDYRENEQPADLAPETAHVVYSSPVIGYGKRGDNYTFPAKWMTVIPKWVAEHKLNAYEVAAIMWNENIPEDVTASNVITIIAEHLAAKAAQGQS